MVFCFTPTPWTYKHFSFLKKKFQQDDCWERTHLQKSSLEPSRRGFTETATCNGRQAAQLAGEAPREAADENATGKREEAQSCVAEDSGHLMAC